MTLASQKPDIARSRSRIVFVAFLLIAAFFLITEHRAHLLPYLGWLPFLFLLACPLMHVFMHGGHGDTQDHGGMHGLGDSQAARKEQP